MKFFKLLGLANRKHKKKKDIAVIKQDLAIMNHKIDSILRHLYMAGFDELSAPYSLTSQRFKMVSQNEEDGIVLALFKRIGVTDRRFIEIGCGSNGGNSGFLAQECGWKGLMVDRTEANIETIKARFAGHDVVAVKSFVTRENINELIKKSGFIGEIDLLSMDIDGNDYWVWDAIDVCSPRVVIMEYNWKFGSEKAMTIAYDATFDRHRSNVRDYYGASLAALNTLATRKGYRLVACGQAGVNAFFLRNDVEPSVFGCSVAKAFRCQDKYDRSDVLAQIRKAGLPLVEIERIAGDVL